MAWRQDILKDLGNHLQEIRKGGDRVILMGDFNENVQKGEIKKFMANNNLRNALIMRHGEEIILPATYDKGRHSVDMIAVSDDINPEAIKKAGCIPFYSYFISDHRGIYIDIDIEELF